MTRKEACELWQKMQEEEAKKTKQRMYKLVALFPKLTDYTPKFNEYNGLWEVE